MRRRRQADPADPAVRSSRAPRSRRSGGVPGSAITLVAVALALVLSGCGDEPAATGGGEHAVLVVIPANGSADELDLMSIEDP
jgi:hypothetical protein